MNVLQMSVHRKVCLPRLEVRSWRRPWRRIHGIAARADRFANHYLCRIAAGRAGLRRTPAPLAANAPGTPLTRASATGNFTRGGTLQRARVGTGLLQR